MKIHNSLLMFFLFLCLGTHLSAQTGKKEDEVQTWIMIEDHLFRSIPEGVKEKMQTMSFVVTESVRVMVITLRSGEMLSDEEIRLAVPLEEIPDGEEFMEKLQLQQAHSRVVTVMSEPSTKKSAVKVGEQIPAFSAMDTKGVCWTREHMLGKPTVLNFWYIGCAPCIKEMPDLNEWMKEVPDVNYLAVTWNTAEQIEKIVTITPFLFHHLADNLPMFQLFAVQITPTTVLLDKKGIVQEIVIGTSEEKRAHLLSRIKELSAE